MKNMSVRTVNYTQKVCPSEQVITHRKYVNTHSCLHTDNMFVLTVNITQKKCPSSQLITHRIKVRPHS